MPDSGQLALTSEPSPSCGDGRLTRAQLDAWSEMYGVEHRQLRRWIDKGKAAGHPCPLDNPVAMPAWVDAHIEKVRGVVRDKVSAAASAAASAARAGSPESEPGTSVPPELPKEAVPVGRQASAMVAPLDLETVGGVEGDSVAFFRKVFGAIKMQLEEAYKSGTEDRIRTLHKRLETAGESLRKHEVAAEARAKRLGDYLDRAEVFNEITAALNTLALMREHRISRVRAELADLDPEAVERVAAALAVVGRAEEAVLRNLSAMKTPDDLLHALAA